MVKILITETLTKERMAKLREPKEQHGFKGGAIDSKTILRKDHSLNIKPKILSPIIEL